MTCNWNTRVCNKSLETEAFKGCSLDLGVAVSIYRFYTKPNTVQHFLSQPIVKCHVVNFNSNVSDLNTVKGLH